MVDFGSLAVCVALVVALPAPQLHADIRPRRLLSSPVLTPLVFYASVFVLEQGIAQALVKQATSKDPAQYQVHQVTQLFHSSYLLLCSASAHFSDSHSRSPPETDSAAGHMIVATHSTE